MADVVDVEGAAIVEVLVLTAGTVESEAEGRVTKPEVLLPAADNTVVDNALAVEVTWVDEVVEIAVALDEVVTAI